jgi:hypothetical protein
MCMPRLVRLARGTQGGSQGPAPALRPEKIATRRRNELIAKGAVNTGE